MKKLIAILLLIPFLCGYQANWEPYPFDDVKVEPNKPILFYEGGLTYDTQLWDATWTPHEIGTELVIDFDNFEVYFYILGIKYKVVPIVIKVWRWEFLFWQIREVRE